MSEETVSEYKKQIADLTEKLHIYEKASGFCEKHKPTAGWCSCLKCVCIELSRAISRIDYALGPPNEMELSAYDVHCEESVVVENAQRAAYKLRKAHDTFLSLAEQIKSTLACLDGVEDVPTDSGCSHGENLLPDSGSCRAKENE